LSGEVGRSPENCAVQDILFSIHEELVSLRERLKATEKHLNGSTVTEF
jgi:hypothetical protein